MPVGCYLPPTIYDWDARRRPALVQPCDKMSYVSFGYRADEWDAETDQIHFPTEPSIAQGNLEELFRRLTHEWVSEIGAVSSLSVMTSHHKYQEIERLGWDVVPLLLADLEQRRGFWFTALNKITGISPYDPRDAGNFARMTDAWITWGKRKGLI